MGGCQSKEPSKGAYADNGDLDETMLEAGNTLRMQGKYQEAFVKYGDAHT